MSGLSIDYKENKLYWISSVNGTINRCNFDGSGLEVLETVRNQLRKATALAIMGKRQWTMYNFFSMLQFARISHFCGLVYVEAFCGL